jgi:hypothetical protein
MKITKNMFILLAVIFILTFVIVILNRQVPIIKPKCKGKKVKFNLPMPLANQHQDASVVQYINPMPKRINDKVRKNYAQDLDRQPLEREIMTLLPANEAIKANYKDWNVKGLEKELYASDMPLFNGKVDLVTPEINSNQRRINFY